MGYGDRQDQVAASVNKIRAAHRLIERKKCKHPSSRKKLEADTPAWMKHYLGASYPLPWGQVHLDIIAGAEKAQAQGGKFAVAAPRGTGKSSVLWGVALKFALTGVVRFPALVPWETSARGKALRFWKIALCHNKKLLEDYPEYCQPFAASRGSSQKCLTLGWSDTGEICGAQLRTSGGMIVFPDGQGAIGSATINGNPRGLNLPTESGEILRPDLVLIDDPQDKETARSPQLTANIIDIIDTDVLLMAGPDSRMPAFLSGTVLRPDDVMTHYLESKDWQSVKVGQIVTWPTNLSAWDPFESFIMGQDEPSALAYYSANKAMLTAGMTVSWNERYDKARGEPDGLYSAMRDFYFMGKTAFMAERQNEPIKVDASFYEINPQLVAGRLNGFDRLCLPEAVEWIVAAADVNYVGLNWVVLAATVSGVIYCPAYGKYTAGGAQLYDPEGGTKAAEAVAIQRGILAWLREIAGLQLRCGNAFRPVRHVAVDCGNWSDLIVGTVQGIRLPGITAYPIRGAPSSTYRPQRDAVRVGDGWHEAKWRKGNVIVTNADYYRETVQRSFLAAPGTTGSISLYTPGPNQSHAELAREICAEKIDQRLEGPKGVLYKWTRASGARWDKLDALVYARTLLAVAGLLPGGGAVRTRRYVETRKARVPIEN